MSSSGADVGRVERSERKEDEEVSVEFPRVWYVVAELALLCGVTEGSEDTLGTGTFRGLPQKLNRRSKSPRLFDMLDVGSKEAGSGISRVSRDEDCSDSDRKLRSKRRAAVKLQGFEESLSESESIVEDD